MYRFMYSISNINNGVLSSQKAMPQKDSTSNNDSTFAMDRHSYIESLPSNAVTNQMKLTKKWTGGNRDASQIIANRRINETGVGSLNAAKTPLSFTTVVPINTVRDARHRVRSGGASVPAKVTHKYTNAPIFY